MNNKIIIFEGLDRCGKDTQINLLIERLKNIVFHKLHYSSLPFKDDTDTHISYSKNLYNDMFRLLMLSNNFNINLILNRSHIGEAVYSKYRNYSGDFVFDIERNYVDSLNSDSDLYLITLINEPGILIKRDDGNSYSKNVEDIQTEIDGFKRAHNLSAIKNKLLLNCLDMTPLQINELILNFIHKNK